LGSIGSIYNAKELAQTYQSLLLVEISVVNGPTLYLSTHPLSHTYWGTPSAGSYEYNGHEWIPRIVSQNIAATQAMSDLGVDTPPTLQLVLADPDAVLYQYEQDYGFKGATVRIYSVMWDAGDTATGSFSSDSPAPVKFVGICAAAAFDDRTLTFTATSLLSMGNCQVPGIRIQPLCSWSFPSTSAQRLASVADDSSQYYQCGYSWDQADGVGNPDPASGGAAAFSMCDYAWDSCIARLGDASAAVPIMQDQGRRWTGRFGGYQYLPSLNAGMQRNFVTGAWSQITNAQVGPALYGNSIPQNYGQTWINPIITGVYSDGNYTGFECIIGYGVVNAILAVIVNGTYVWQLASDAADRPNNHIPVNNTVANGSKAAGLGYWITVCAGQRNGIPNQAPGWGNQGDPYGSVSAIYVNVINTQVAAGSIPTVQILVQGSRLRMYTTPTAYTDATTNPPSAVTSNPVWILLDLLTWANWRYSDIDIQSFIDAAAVCDTQIKFENMAGEYINIYNEVAEPAYLRFSVGFSLSQRQAVGPLIQGLRNAMRAMLYFDYNTGLLSLKVKRTLAAQQSAPIVGSNYNTPIAGYLDDGVTPSSGYAAYSFDQSNILKDDSGKLQISVHQLTNNDSPNKSTVTFQDRENGYSQDSLTIVDTEDVARLGFEIYGSMNVVGPQTFDHINRITNTWFAENYRGNGRPNDQGSYVGDTGGTLIFDLTTSMKALHLVVGHICLVSDLQHGITNQLARVTRIAPSQNFETCQVTLQWHNDIWYYDTYGQATAQPIYAKQMMTSNRPPFAWRADYEVPIAGDALYDPTDHSFGIAQTYVAMGDGSLVAQALITGKIPVNSFPGNPGQPQLELIGIGSSGGGYPSGTSYVAAIVDYDSLGLNISPLSNPVGVTLTSPQDALSFAVQNWPNNPSGYLAFAGQSELALSFQESFASLPTGSPSIVKLTNAYNVASLGPPDSLFENFRWRLNVIDYPGVWMAAVAAVSTASLQISMAYHDVNFFSNQWHNRILSVLGVKSQYPGATPNVPIANFLVSGNDTSGNLSLAAGNPTTCVGGGSLNPGDIVTLRFQPTFGEDSTGYYFEDLGLVNAMNYAPVQFPILEGVDLLTIWELAIGGYQTGSGSSITHAVQAQASGQYIIRNGGSSRLPRTPSPDYAYPIPPGSIVLVTGTGVPGLDGEWAISYPGAPQPLGSTNNIQLVGSNSVPIQQPFYGGTVSYTTGVPINSLVGDLALIIAGVGQGTYAKIASNTATRFYIQGTWPVQPDSTSIIILIQATPFVEAFSDQISNGVLGLVESFGVNMPNYSATPILIRASTQGPTAQYSPEPLDHCREMYVFGNSDLAMQPAYNIPLIGSPLTGIPNLTANSQQLVTLLADVNIAAAIGYPVGAAMSWSIFIDQSGAGNYNAIFDPAVYIGVGQIVSGPGTYSVLTFVSQGDGTHRLQNQMIGLALTS
jgi:hypothetical protein